MRSLFLYCGNGHLGHILYKLVKQITRIVRARACLRMVLHRKAIFRFHTHARYGVVVDMNVRDFDVGMRLYCFTVYCKPVVLRSDFAFSGKQVFNRMVDASVSAEHLEGWDTIRKTDNLVTKTDTE